MVSLFFKNELEITADNTTVTSTLKIMMFLFIFPILSSFSYFFVSFN
jgi:hypothetical protein